MKDLIVQPLKNGGPWWGLMCVKKLSHSIDGAYAIADRSLVPLMVCAPRSRISFRVDSCRVHTELTIELICYANVVFGNTVIRLRVLWT
jgi:hypothetical protein